MLEVPNVEYRYCKLDVCVMSDTVHRVQPAGLTERILFRRTLYKAKYINAISGSRYTPSVGREHHSSQEDGQLECISHDG